MFTQKLLITTKIIITNIENVKYLMQATNKTVMLICLKQYENNSFFIIYFKIKKKNK